MKKKRIFYGSLNDTELIVSLNDGIVYFGMMIILYKLVARPKPPQKCSGGLS